MFHRRLLLLALLMFLPIALLGAQLIRLTVVEADEYRAIAEQRLDRTRWLPTWRGTIRDRHGRPLAIDMPSDDVAIPYELISGEWSVSQAARAARRKSGSATWAMLDPEQRQASIEQELPEYEGRARHILSLVSEQGELGHQQLQQRLDQIKQRVHTLRTSVWDRQRRMEAEQFDDDADRTWKGRPIREQRQAHVVLRQVEEETAFLFRKAASEHPEMIEVQDSTARVNPWDQVDVLLERDSFPSPIRSDQPLPVTVHGVGDHLVGSVRGQVWPEDIQRRPFRDPDTGRIDLGGYRVGNDTVGSSGIEDTFEDHLRGSRGSVHTRLDTLETTRLEPVPGDDLDLTIDVSLQARIQALLEPEVGLAVVQQYHRGWNSDGSPKAGPLPLGWELNGAVVVMDVESAEVLAAVSSPTLAHGRSMSKARRADDQPQLNRAIEGVYQPGSIVKPLVLAAALEEDVIAPGATIQCNGHYFPNTPDSARCWIYRPPVFATHSGGTGKGLGGSEAIARSCNIYFYTLADRLGIQRMVDWYHSFGLGVPLGSGAANETRGILPDQEQISRLLQRGDRFSQILLGIGQGPMAWSPLQAANAYATLARHGRIKDARLVRDVSPLRTGDLMLEPAHVAVVLEGMRQVLSERHGSGSSIRMADGSREKIINAEGIITWGKTGTAQTTPLRLDSDGDGTRETVIPDADHAWFVGLVGNESDRTPRYAIAVLLEHAGSGGRAAGPLANQVIRALQAEGYLETGVSR